MAEVTGQVNLGDWPEGTRLICRRERPHPGAQLSFTDLDGHRFQCFITDQHDEDIAKLEVDPPPARSGRGPNQDAQGNRRELLPAVLPLIPGKRGMARARARCAHDVMAWTQLLTLEGEHRSCEPKRLRYRILHVAGHLTRHAPVTTLHPPRDCALHRRHPPRAFARPHAIPAPGCTTRPAGPADHRPQATASHLPQNTIAGTAKPKLSSHSAQPPQAHPTAPKRSDPLHHPKAATSDSY